MLFKLHAIGLVGLTCVEAVRYGTNHVPVRRDNELVAANFENVQGYELQSPAFLNPDSVPADFANGTAGPTSDAEVGKRLSDTTYETVNTD